jgi:hypothetical protein
MSDPTVIYLQPECCADPDTGRLWCEDDAPVDCEEGAPWTKYVLAADAQAAVDAVIKAALDYVANMADRRVRKYEDDMEGADAPEFGKAEWAAGAMHYFAKMIRAITPEQGKASMKGRT